MKLFLTWSGEASRLIALALYDFVPKILQTVVPFMSERDVDKGTRWQSGLAGELDSSDVGIICLTPDNLSAPWILFEAGALSKKMYSDPRVYTYLHKLTPAEVVPPLSMFQHTVAHKEDTRTLMHSIRKYTNSPNPTENGLNDLFNMTWPRLEQTLDTTVLATAPAPRESRRMIEESLELTRAIARRSVSDAKTLDMILAYLLASSEAPMGKTLSLDEWHISLDSITDSPSERSSILRRAGKLFEELSKMRAQSEKAQLTDEAAQ